MIEKDLRDIKEFGIGVDSLAQQEKHHGNARAMRRRPICCHDGFCYHCELRENAKKEKNRKEKLDEGVNAR